MPWLNNYRFILASQSPRRQELLKLLDVDYVVAEKYECNEEYPLSIDVEDIPKYLSNLKSVSYKGCLTDNEILITADTLVISDGRVLGKPDSPESARSMLKLLSGKTHAVITGVTLRNNSKSIVFSDKSLVSFKNLTDCEIEYYVEHFKPFDKAGSYGIQEWIGAIGITSISGSYFNIVGLPTEKLYEQILSFINND